MSPPEGATSFIIEAPEWADFVWGPERLSEAIEALARAAAVFIGRGRQWFCNRVGIRPARVNGTGGGNPVVDSHPAQRIVAAATQQDAAAGEFFIGADFPAAAVHDHRGGPVVESGPFQVAQLLVGLEGAAAKALGLVESN